MPTKSIGLALLIIGVLVLAVSLLADYIGLGTDSSAIGWAQLLGAGVGLVIALGGLVLALRRKKTQK